MSARETLVTRVRRNNEQRVCSVVDSCNSVLWNSGLEYKRDMNNCILSSLRDV